MTEPSDVASSTAGNDNDVNRDTPAASASLQHHHPKPDHYLELTHPSSIDDLRRSLDMQDGEPGRDEDATPTSQVPSVAGSHEEDDGKHHQDDASDGYFGPVTSHELLAPQLTKSSVTASLIEPSSSPDTAISHLDLNNLARAHLRTPRHDDHSERPVPQHTLSNSSTASTTTVRQADHLRRTTTRPGYLPKFPDQSYSALHAQQYPSYYPSQVLRPRSSNPSSYNSYIAGAKGRKPSISATPSKSRTADNSPSGSPGLFTPLTSPTRPKSVHDEASGSYSSPFLHYTQRQVPKE